MKNVGYAGFFATLLAIPAHSSPIVLNGQLGVGLWSPSHPHIYPYPVVSTPQMTIPQVDMPPIQPVYEPVYVPLTPLTDSNGNPYIQ